MRHFPIFRDLRGRRVIVSGGGETALAKLRLLLRTEAKIAVYAAEPAPEIKAWAKDGRLALTPRAIAEGDAICAAMLVAANAEPVEDERAAAIGRRAGALANIVDDLEGSDFITPALVDRDPVTVAIGTEGTAPVLARKIKADTEARLDPSLGALASVGAARRAAVAHLDSAARRRLWTQYYEETGPRAVAEGGAEAAAAALDALIASGTATAPREGHVHVVGAGPGDPELLTLKARKALHEADVVIYDRLVSAGIIELARREARLIEVGKIPGGPSWKQADIDALIVAEALAGATVVRLKSGDPAMFGRLDEEMDALDAAGVPFSIIPGITAAAAAAASIKVSLTRRGRNKALRILTGHDVDGFAEHDWRGLSQKGATAAIYMGVRAARFLQGRLMLHGASPDTTVTAVENASRSTEKIVSAPLSHLPETLAEAGIKGPAILFIGLAPRGALAALDTEPALAAPTRMAEAF